MLIIANCMCKVCSPVRDHSPETHLIDHGSRERGKI